MKAMFLGGPADGEIRDLSVSHDRIEVAAMPGLSVEDFKGTPENLKLNIWIYYRDDEADGPFLVYRSL